MSINYVFDGNPLNGTPDDDIIVDLGFYNGGPNTINAGDGDDLVIGDIGFSFGLLSATSNGSIATATDLDAFGNNVWTTDENPLVANSAVPHAMALVEATAGETEYFSVAAGAGKTITVDIAFGSGSAIGTDVDTVVQIIDGAGNVLATNDDGGNLGGLGSNSFADSFLTFVAPSAGVYYIKVSNFDGSAAGAAFAGGETFVLNVSVSGHALTTNPSPTGDDTINGGLGDDSLFGVNGNDAINGDDGNDTINGGTGTDTIDGGIGDDLIIWRAGDGSDTIDGGSDNDTLDLSRSTRGWNVDLRAGTGSDSFGNTLSLTGVESLIGTNYADVLRSYGGYSTIYALGGNDLVYAVDGLPENLDGGDGVDTIDTTDFNLLNSPYTIDMVSGLTNYDEYYTNFENLVSGNTADTITGTDGANVITTNGGDDAISAGDGADTVNAGAGDDYLYGEGANDRLNGGAGFDTLDGAAGNDIMTGGSEDDDYFVDVSQDRAIELAGGGYDSVYSSAASYTLSAEVEALYLTGAAINGAGNLGDNFLAGTNAANTLSGKDGNDAMSGFDGADTMIGGRGGDYMDGGADSDTYYVDDAGDTVVESAGGGATDRVYSSINYTLPAEVENLTLQGNARIGTGNALGNVITGTAGNDTLNGLDGADNIKGGAANDTINGGVGDDTIFGETGRDSMTGGTGLDRFTFRAGETGATNGTADLITDFKRADGDKIVLSLIDANTNTTPANEAFTFIGTAVFSGVAGQLRYFQGGGVGDTYIQGDTNGDGATDFVIRLTGLINLISTDFVL